MPRSIWKGSISFGLVHVPVGLYSAESRDEVKLSMLDKRDLAPVGYRRYNKRTGDEVPSDEIVKGYEVEEDRYVVLTDEDFRAANAEATQTVEIVDFVDANAIDPVYYDRPYYLAPLGRGDKGYALLREVMRRKEKIGIARVVIRTREYLAALVSRGPVMVLDLLRFANELRDPNALAVPGDDLSEHGVTEREVEMAERLVESMVVPWEPEKYRNEYRDQLLELVHRKAETGEAKAVAGPIPAAEEAETEVIDIMSLLKRSVEERGRAGKAGTAREEAGGGGRRTGSKRKTA